MSIPKRRLQFELDEVFAEDGHESFLMHGLKWVRKFKMRAYLHGSAAERKGAEDDLLIRADRIVHGFALCLSGEDPVFRPDGFVCQSHPR